MRKFEFILGIFAVLILATVVCAEEQGVAILKGTAIDSKIEGKVTFTPTEHGLQVEAAIENAPPGKHGFHIHEVGSCNDLGQAAGGHFNPDSVEHGLLQKDGHAKAHAGDMGNITIGSDGKGTLSVVLHDDTLGAGKYAVVGRSVILHEKEDDFSQPTGNAGSRIACGVIEAQTQEAK